MGGGATRQWQDEPQTIPYEPKTAGYRIWLFGDSILDNSYWNYVEENMTSEQLKKMVPNVEVRDRSAERQDSMTMINCLTQGLRYQVA